MEKQINHISIKLISIIGLDNKPAAGGTWFGVSKQGKVGILLNMLTPYDPLPNKTGRGMINVIICYKIKHLYQMTDIPRQLNMQTQ